jgi:hypothetical protein
MKPHLQVSHIDEDIIRILRAHRSIIFFVFCVELHTHFIHLALVLGSMVGRFLGPGILRDFCLVFGN